MLSLQDAHVVARDLDLPALRVLLDEEAALELLQEILPELEPVAVRCTYLRYKPRMNCLAAWTLETRQGERRFYAKAYSKHRHHKIRQATDRANRRGRGEPRVLVVDKLALMIASFPHDAQLPALEQLWDRSEGKSLISRLVPEQTALQAARIVPLQYKPERRFVARLDVAGHPAAVLKLHTSSRYRQARRAMKSLGRLSCFATAPALGHSDRHHALLLSWLVGTPLSSLWNSQQWSPATGAAIGRALAGLHDLPTRKLPLRTLDHEIQQIHQQSTDFDYASESMASRLHQLTVRCAAALPQQPATSVPTHGDLHPGQILLDGESVSMIDLDNVALGKAAYDLGNFFACVEHGHLLGLLPEAQKKQLLTDFFAGYQRERRGAIDHRDVQSYAAAGLIRLIHEPFRRRFFNWHDVQEKILERVEALLAEAAVPHRQRSSTPVGANARRGQASQNVEVVDPFVAQEDPGLPRLREALDPGLACDTIGEAARQFYNDDSLALRSIRVVRHKLGRRCLIAYRFHRSEQRGELTLLGKVHAKRRHQQSYCLQRALWRGGFDDQSADGISVPRPVGVVAPWNMWLQELVPGQSGWEALLGPQGCSVATRIVDAAHKYHQANVPTERTHSVDDELQVLEHRLSHVMHRLPSLRSRIEGVLEACRELALTLRPMSSSGIHRDFYPDQILVDSDRIYLLDHDLYCYGDRRLDIGNFCAHLIETSLRCEETAVALLASESSIANRFVALAGEDQRQAVGVYTTLSLVRHIYLSTQFAERQSSTRLLLAECEQRLAGHLAFGKPAEQGR